MVVPNIRNPNRYRTQQAAKPTRKSQYHLEPNHAVSYKRVGRRTKGGSGGGGYIYSNGAYGSGNDGEGGGNITMGIIIGIGMVLVFCVAFCFKSDDSLRREYHNNRRAARNNVYRRRNERATSNDIANNTDADNDATPPERHVDMKRFFHFQTVLPDKSNLDPSVLREEAMVENTASDDDSVIEDGTNDPPGKTGSKNKKNNSFLSSRFLMSTWRRPTANDECSICLQSYQPGQNICLAKNPECKHVYHQDCIEEWLNQDHKHCPLCRENIMYIPP